MSNTNTGIVKARPSAFNNIDPTAVVRREGFNPRADFGDIEELAKSIMANGVLQPLRVRRLEGGKFELIDGDRRMTAIELAVTKGHTFADGVPAYVVDRNQDEVTSLIQMFEANTGKPFMPLEEAAAYKRMRDAGMTLQQIADRVGRNHVHINNTLALLEASDEVKQAVASGEISATTGKQIAVAGRKDKETQKKLLETAKEAKTQKGGRVRVDKAIRAVQEAKAAKKGRQLKIRALDDAALSELGATTAARLAEMLSDLGVATGEALLVEISNDSKLAAAYTMGALQALKAAAGQKVSLKV